MTSRDIPAAIKRQVRQRCGFGCVVCGKPLYEYEHMLGWANVREHDVDEITLLCDGHHREKTSGLLPIEVVREANANPFNIRNAASSPYVLHFSGPSCRVDVGNNVILAPVDGPFYAVVIDGFSLVGFRIEDGRYLLNALIVDECDDPVMVIEDNSLVHSVGLWDIEFVGRRLILRSAAHQILIDIVFEPPDSIKLQRGWLRLNGVEVYVRPDYVFLVNNLGLFAGSYFEGASVAFAFGHQIPSAATAVFGVPRYGIDRAAALRQARSAVKDAFGADAEMPGDPDPTGN